MSQNASISSVQDEVDIYRDTPLRLLGYANEVGEAFRSQVKKSWVWASYGVASAYVVADTVDKSRKMYNQTNPEDKERTKRVLIVAGDTLMWQALASVAIPGFTINRLCATSLYVLKRTTKLPKPTRKWITTGLGLACIPFIVHPIDTFVTKLMDNSVRKWIVIEKLKEE
ncbi:hypothetical protein B566_EDAN006709 [Ephemera danica]|nr:hypothetical protein B566_EDAN006709 [Ephemera danica]